MCKVIIDNIFRRKYNCEVNFSIFNRDVDYSILFNIGCKIIRYFVKQIDNIYIFCILKLLIRLFWKKFFGKIIIYIKYKFLIKIRI